MKKYFSLGPAAIVVFGLLCAPACRQKPQARQYEENDTAAAQASNQPQARTQSASWRWVKPLPWREEASAGLRLVTFYIGSREDSGQCTLIPLPGDGGGIQANVQRWLEQLQLPLFSPPELADFLGRQKKMQTQSGLPVDVIDFTTLSHPQARSGPSMLIAVIPGENQTLFVKMNGRRALLEKNREIFYEFCRSLSPGA
jgi:hypothetical protein